MYVLVFMCKKERKECKYIVYSISSLIYLWGILSGCLKMFSSIIGSMGVCVCVCVSKCVCIRQRQTTINCPKERKLKRRLIVGKVALWNNFLLAKSIKEELVSSNGDKFYLRIFYFVRISVLLRLGLMRSNEMPQIAQTYAILPE